MSQLRLDRLSLTIDGKHLLHDVSLALEAGQLIALLGPNGAGKTTLLRCALGLARPSGGNVTLDGHAVLDLPARDRAAQLGWLPQHTSASEPLSVLEVVTAARFRVDEARSRSEAAAAAALERVNLSAFARAPITELSGGERQRAALAALIAQDPRIALLDEPGNHLDPAQQIEIYRLLGSLYRDGLGILLVTHDVNLLSHLGPAEQIRVFGLKQGRVAFDTHYAAPELKTELERLYDVPFAELPHAGRRILLPATTS